MEKSEIPSVRDEFEQIRENFDFDEQKSIEGVIITENTVFRIIHSFIDFDLRKEKITVEVQQSSMTTEIVCEEIEVAGKFVYLYGEHEEEYTKVLV